MWIIKVELLDKDCIWATRCKKFNIYDYQYPLGFYQIKKSLALLMYHILEGNEKNIKEFIKDVKKDKRVQKLEVKKNRIISLIIEDKSKLRQDTLKKLYNQKLIYIKPGINFPNGKEVWEIGSFNREDLMKLYKYLEKYYQGRLIHIKQITVPKLFIPQIMPELTEKQQEAFVLASKNGYYEFPRKTNLHKLAKINKISRPTFEEHLRKAEIRLLKFMKELILK